MSETDWGDLESVPRQRSGPRVMLLSLGCLLPLLILFVGGWWLKEKFNQATDPERQWPALAELVPYDRRPEGWTLKFGLQLGLLGMEGYVLTQGSEEKPDRAVTFLRLGEKDAKKTFDTARDEVEPWTPPGMSEPVSTVTIQGRELRVVRLSGEEQRTLPGASTILSGDEPQEGTAEETAGEASEKAEETAPPTTLALDLSSADLGESLVLFWVERHPGGPTVDELSAFLAPFHIGPER